MLVLAHSLLCLMMVACLYLVVLVLGWCCGPVAVVVGARWCRCIHHIHMFVVPVGIVLVLAHLLLYLFSISAGAGIGVLV